jgi:hypothetical protein
MTGSQQDQAEEVNYLDQDRHVPRAEFIRLLQQALSELGHPDVSRSLEEATGLVCESAHMAQMKQHVLGGDWLRACDSVHACTDLTAAQSQKVQFMLLRQHALEVRAARQLTRMQT